MSSAAAATMAPALGSTSLSATMTRRQVEAGTASLASESSVCVSALRRKVQTATSIETASAGPAGEGAVIMPHRLAAGALARSWSQKPSDHARCMIIAQTPIRAP